MPTRWADFRALVEATPGVTQALSPGGAGLLLIVTGDPATGTERA